jgi:hypothetical protein
MGKIIISEKWNNSTVLKGDAVTEVSELKHKIRSAGFLLRPAKPRSRKGEPASPGRVIGWAGLGQGRRGDGASSPRARACSTASWRRCAPSLSYRWRMWVLTVFTDR